MIKMKKSKPVAKKVESYPYMVPVMIGAMFVVMTIVQLMTI